jgi:hypothetical protein
MSERRVLILLLVVHIIIFSLIGMTAMAENNSTNKDVKNSYVFIISKTNRTESLYLTADENSNISILFQHVDFHIIAKNNTTYKILLDSLVIAKGTMNSSCVIIHKDFKEIQGHLKVIIGSDIHDFHTVIIKNRLSAKDIREEEGNYLKVTPSEFAWVQWKAALGTFVASLFSLPVSYVIVKFYLERRGEYAT